MLPNQMYGRKLSGDLKREMVNFAAENLEPNDSNEIAKALDKLGLSRKSSTLVRDLPPLLFVQLTFLNASFGLKTNPGGLATNPDMLTVNERAIAAPRLAYAENRSATPNNGELSLRGRQFEAAKQMPRRAILRAGVSESYEPPVAELTQCFQECGLDMKDQPAPKKYHVDPRNEKVLEQELQSISKREISLLWVILPTANAEVYARIKSLADNKGKYRGSLVDIMLLTPS